MFIGYFDESKKNITIDDQKSIVTSYINKHQMNVDIFFSSTDFSSIIAQINMVSSITKQALNKKREQGYKLGRDFGYKHKRYIWDGKEEEIKNKLMSGMSRLRTAKEVGISVVSLYKYLKLNPELKKMTGGVQNA